MVLTSLVNVFLPFYHKQMEKQTKCVRQLYLTLNIMQGRAAIHERVETNEFSLSVSTA
jgi:hypothetical protein